jgi:hypothetical protein
MDRQISSILDRNFILFSYFVVLRWYASDELPIFVLDLPLFGSAVSVETELVLLFELLSHMRECSNVVCFILLVEGLYYI